MKRWHLISCECGLSVHEVFAAGRFGLASIRRYTCGPDLSYSVSVTKGNSVCDASFGRDFGAALSFAFHPFRFVESVN